jgi:hypothetical protein
LAACEPGCGFGPTPDPHPMASATTTTPTTGAVASFRDRDILFRSMSRRWLYALVAITAVEAISYYLGLDRLHEGGPNHLRTAVIPVLSTNYRVQRPPGPFRLTDQQRLAFFILWRYAADHPRRVRLRALTGNQVLSERSAVLFRTGP